MAKKEVNFKVILGGDVRRFSLHPDDAGSISRLRRRLARAFQEEPEVVRHDWRLLWTDADGDEVTADTNEDLWLALEEMEGPVYRFRVAVDKGRKEGEEKAEVISNFYPC